MIHIMLAKIKQQSSTLFQLTLIEILQKISNVRVCMCVCVITYHQINVERIFFLIYQHKRNSIIRWHNILINNKPRLYLWHDVIMSQQNVIKSLTHLRQRKWGKDIAHLSQRVLTSKIENGLLLWHKVKLEKNLSSVSCSDITATKTRCSTVSRI